MEPRHTAKIDIRKSPDTFVDFRARLTPHLAPQTNGRGNEAAFWQQQRDETANKREVFVIAHALAGNDRLPATRYIGGT